MSFVELFRGAQFHGSKRLADKIHRWEWAVALLLLLWAAIAVLCTTIARFLENPTYIDHMPSVHLHSTPFPSVLVFPEIAYPEYKKDTFMDQIKIPPGLNASYVRESLHQLAAFYSPDVLYSPEDLEMLQDLLDYNDLDVHAAGRRLTTSCEEAVVKCQWLGRIVNCSTIFQLELTAYGFCCIFNGRSLNREIKEFGLHKVKPEHTLYTRHVGPTSGSGLMLAVNQSQMPVDLDLTYKWVLYRSNMFQLAIQEGQLYVDSSVNGTPLSPSVELWAGYGMEQFKIADDARALSDELLHCRMSEEPLKFFPIYNKRYCLLECEMARTIQKCKCMHTTHPGLEGEVHCRAKSLVCAQQTAVPYGTDECRCPPECDTVKDYVITQSFDLITGSYPIDDFYDGLDFKKVSVVRVFLLSRRTKVFARKAYFDTVQLFAQLGGVFNVFFGCSILTILELVQLAYQGIRSLWPSNYKHRGQGLVLPPVDNYKKEKKVKFNLKKKVSAKN